MHNDHLSEPSALLLEHLKKLLLAGTNPSQEAICMALEAQGHRINQSKVSRLLRKINAIKSKNEHGDMVYCLPHDASPPPIETKLTDLILDVVANEATIIIRTSPGSASLIARILDHKKCHILGTIAGDDAIFIAPESIHTIQKTLSLIRSYLCYER